LANPEQYVHSEQPPPELKKGKIMIKPTNQWAMSHQNSFSKSSTNPEIWPKYGRSRIKIRMDLRK